MDALNIVETEYRGCKLELVWTPAGWQGCIGNDISLSFPSLTADNAEYAIDVMKSQVDCWLAIGVSLD